MSKSIVFAALAAICLALDGCSSWSGTTRVMSSDGFHWRDYHFVEANGPYAAQAAEWAEECYPASASGAQPDIPACQTVQQGGGVVAGAVPSIAPAVGAVGGAAVLGGANIVAAKALPGGPTVVDSNTNTLIAAPKAIAVAKPTQNNNQQTSVNVHQRQQQQQSQTPQQSGSCSQGAMGTCGPQ